MKSTTWIGALALFAVLLSGCGTKAPVQNTASGAGTEAAAGQQQTQTAPGVDNKKPAMNEKEMQMAMTFQNLIRMDKTEGLALTKEQAQTMLPIVQESVTNKELTEASQTKLTAALNADQKKFIDEAATRMSGRQGGGQGRTGGGQMTDEQRQQRMQEGGRNGQPGQGAPRGNGGPAGGNASGGSAGTGGPAGGTASGDSAGSSGQAGGSAGNGGPGGGMAGANGQGGMPGGGRGFGGANSGQQLIELLQAKLK